MIGLIALRGRAFVVWLALNNSPPQLGKHILVAKSRPVYRAKDLGQRWEFQYWELGICKLPEQPRDDL